MALHRSAGGPVRPARRLRRNIADAAARIVVKLGGFAIIASIFAILVVIVVELLPLFRSPKVAPASGPLPIRDALALSVEEYREIACVVHPDAIRFVSTRDGAVLREDPIEGRATCASAGLIGTDDGLVIPVSITYAVTYPESGRKIEPVVKFEKPVHVGEPVRAVAQGRNDAGPVIVALLGGGELAIITVTEKKALVGPPKKTFAVRRFTLPAEATAIALDNRAEDLIAGTASGDLLRVDLRGEPALAERVKAGAPVSLLGYLIGDRTLVVGGADGSVTTWQFKERLLRMHAFAPHAAPVTAFSPSQRDKGFLTADASGIVRLHHGTTARSLLEVRARGPVLALAYGPKADGFFALGRELEQWNLDHPHPEVTIASLFGRVWYEGYEKPEMVWQSTGGTDDFEPKLGLTPLIFGTLKGTFYALLIAVPLSIFAAIYTSQFMSARMKANVKPVIETMAALPSVVLGFIAGIWLAPAIHHVLSGVLLLIVTIPVACVLAGWAWSRAPRSWRSGREALLLIPLALLVGWLTFRLGAWVETAFLGGSGPQWIRSALGLEYDQRNCIVVGLAMGFAVIPIIFTITEDSLSNVPAHLSAGSLALGANRWQTAIRVVLPTASPGIFSAVMIGFGRAVGETMIVLMATGNTPIMDLWPFTGFRALSANVAVELPEAPQGGTLFRVLFLAAFLLFVMTFLVNTIAEIVRLRLRRRYQIL